MKKSIFAALLAVLITALSFTMNSVKAAPTLSGDAEGISVLSVSVTVDTQTGGVESELILHNNEGEKKEVTFALPKISAGMDKSSLTVTGLNGKEIKTDDGTVTVSLKAGGYAGLRYEYKAKKNLSYESTIAFDLKQLSNCFHDRIGHLEWIVDMQDYELVLTDAIHPVNYTVSGNRIKVVLDNFLVSDLMDRCYVSRVTHADLNEMLSNVQELVDERMGWGSDPYYSAEYKIYRFILNNYRAWYRDPSFAEKIEHHKNWFDNDYTKAATVYKMYLLQSHTEEQTRIIMDEIETYDKTESFSEDQTEYDRETLNAYLNEYRYFCSYIDDNEYYMMSDAEAALYDQVFRLLDYLIPRENRTYTGYGAYCAPAMDARLYPAEPVVYAVLLSAQPELAGKEVYVPKYDRFIAVGEGQPAFDDPAYNTWYEEHLYEYYITCVPAGNATWINALAPYSESTWHQKEGALGYEYQKYRTVCITENDMADPEAVNDYLNALHGKAVFRSKYLTEGSEEAEEIKRTLGEGVRYYGYRFSYEGTETYPYREFCLDLPAYTGDFDADVSPWNASSVPVVIHGSEPYASVLSVPIITQYTGCLVSPDALIDKVKQDRADGIRCDIGIPGDDMSRILLTDDENWAQPIPFFVAIENIDGHLMEQEIPKQMIQTRDDALKQSAGENNLLLAEAREELKNASVEPTEEESSENETGEETSEGSSEEPTGGETETETETETEETVGTDSSGQTEEQSTEEPASSDPGNVVTSTPTPTPTLSPASNLSPTPTPGSSAVSAGITLVILGVIFVGIAGVVVLVGVIVIVVLVIRSKKKN